MRDRFGKLLTRIKFVVMAGTFSILVCFYYRASLTREVDFSTTISKLVLVIFTTLT